MRGVFSHTTLHFTMESKRKPLLFENAFKVLFYSNEGTHGPGNKTAGKNLTLATTCNTLPRELRQYDMIRYEVHFPNTEWLIWAVPIPGFTTSEDVKLIMEQEEFNIPQLKIDEINLSDKSYKNVKFMEQVSKMKSLRKQVLMKK